MKHIDYQEFIELYNKGLSDTEIGEKLNVGRKLIGKYRKSLNLPSKKDKSLSNNQSLIADIKRLDSTVSSREVALKYNVSTVYINKLRKKYNVPAYVCIKLIDENIEKLKILYEQGKLDTEIAKELGVSKSLIGLYRDKLGLKSIFTYDKISKIDNNKFEELFNKGLSDYAIAKELNMSPDGIYSHRVRHGYVREENYRFNKPIEMTDFQKQVLLGTMLGDASFKMGKDCISPAVSCAHGPRQKEYCEYKAEIFSSLNAKCTYHKRNVPDPRNNIYYEDYTMFIPANPVFIPYYKAFYSTGRKVIPFNLLDDFTAVSLAFMYMDDGSKCSSSYNIATCCFSQEEIIQFQDFLYSKFHIETTLQSNNRLYIKARSSALFEYLISPYFCESMKYKIQTVS